MWNNCSNVDGGRQRLSSNGLVGSVEYSCEIPHIEQSGGFFRPAVILISIEPGILNGIKSKLPQIGLGQCIQ
jgi:hypothetical protein